MGTRVKVDQSTDRNNSDQVQETAGRRNDNEGEYLVTTRNKGVRETRANSIGLPIPP